MGTDVGALTSLGAGLLSFLSPCILPVIPSYLSIIGGVGLGAAGEHGVSRPAASRPRIISATLFFVLGFSAVFIALSVILSKIMFLAGGVSTAINVAAGLLVVVMGFHVLFNFIPFLNYEKRVHVGNGGAWRPGSLAAVFVMGAAFGAGWTPCIGPILTGILFMAAQDGQTAKAVFLLAMYSAGLAVPFLLAAAFFQFFVKHLGRLKKALPWIRRISGVFLVLLGLLIMSGQFSKINALLARYTTW